MSKSITPRTSPSTLQEVAFGFSPTMAQRHAKIALMDSLAKMRLLKELSTLTPEELDRLALTRRGSMKKWATDNAAFLPWLLDAGDTSRRIRVAGQRAIERLEEMLEMPVGSGRDGDTIAPKDLLKATELATSLADMEPAARKEVVYKDESIQRVMEELTEEQVMEQLKLHEDARNRAKLQASPVLDAEEDGGEESA